MTFNKSILNWYFQRRLRKRNIRTGSYSQYGQDLVAFELLGRPDRGVFVDIGANDGVTFSNSLFFEERGWTGVCVEPHPLIFPVLKERRTCHLVNACIAPADGSVTFVAIDGPGNMLSGIKEFLDERHRERIETEVSEGGGSIQEVMIESISPASLLQRFSITRVDYLSIDTEGCELPILKMFDLSAIDIQVIGVENGSRTPELFHYLTSEGYGLAKCVGCDEFYVKS